MSTVRRTLWDESGSFPNVLSPEDAPFVPPDHNFEMERAREQPRTESGAIIVRPECCRSDCAARPDYRADHQRGSRTGSEMFSCSPLMDDYIFASKEERECHLRFLHLTDVQLVRTLGLSRGSHGFESRRSRQFSPKSDSLTRSVPVFHSRS